jgi:multidrug resistance efflux pump
MDEFDCMKLVAAREDEIAKLRAELDTAEAWRRENNDLIIELNIELAEAKKDADRYKHISKAVVDVEFFNNMFHVTTNTKQYITEHLDEAIDAAMKE